MKRMWIDTCDWPELHRHSWLHSQSGHTFPSTCSFSSRTWRDNLKIKKKNYCFHGKTIVEMIHKMLIFTVIIKIHSQQNKTWTWTLLKLEHQLPRHRFRPSGTISPCLDEEVYSSYNLPHAQSPKLQASQETLDVPADLQVGVCSTVFYTTKIMLAQPESKQQSQPCMVRVEINIAESRAGGQVNSHSASYLWVQVCR